MTAILEDSNEQTLDQQLLAVIDAFLSDISGVNLVDASRVSDFALDLRLIISHYNGN